MKIGIIGAMPQETKLLMEEMAHATQTQIHHLTFVQGELSGHTVVLVESGIGKVNSAIATTTLILHFGVTHVINTGSAGALQPGLAIGDVIVSKQVAYHDVDASAFGYAIGQVPRMPLYYVADAQLQHSALRAIAQVSALNGQVGEVVSSDSFIASQEQKNAIVKHFPLASCSEMEGASIAQTCHQFGVPFVVVRAISDTADEQASLTFDEFIVTAGENSAQMVLLMLEELQ